MTEITLDRKVSGAVVSASVMAAAGAAVFLLLPVIIGSAMDTLNLSEKQAGLLASSYFGGYLCACIASFDLVQRIGHKTLAKGSYILLSLSLLTAALPLSPVAVALFMAGAGAGALFGLAIIIVGQTHNADGNFGILLVAQQLFAAALLFILPQWVIPTWGFSGLMLSLSFALGMGFFVLNGIDNSSHEKSSGSTKTITDPQLLRQIITGLFALMVYFAALSAVWAFIERIAADRGLLTDQIGFALAFSMLGGVIGGMLVAIIGGRIGRSIPVWLSLLAFIGVFYGYSTQFGMLSFALVTFIFSLFWNYVLGYQMAIIAALDRADRYSVFIPGAQALGAVTGPTAAGFIIAGQGYTILLIIAGVVTLITSGLFLHLIRSGKNYA